MKNKKGFTLVEMILVVVLLAIITIVALPNIFDAVSESERQKYKNIEDNLFKALELYNSDKQEDIWQTVTSDEIYRPTLSQLQKINSNIEVTDCTVDLLQIDKKSTKIKDATEDENAKYENSYTYKVCITCKDVYKSDYDYCE